MNVLQCDRCTQQSLGPQDEHLWMKIRYESAGQQPEMFDLCPRCSVNFREEFMAHIPPQIDR